MVADDPDLELNPSQPDFSVIALPTTLRLPLHAMAFHLTHRFFEPIGEAGIGNLYGLDAGAQVGLEFRFGLFRGVQLGFVRTSDHTIEFFSEYSLLQQKASVPVGVAALVSIEGAHNFQDTYSPAIGAIVSHEIGEHGAIYVQPIWVGNSVPVAGSPTDRTSTLIVGLGARIRVMKSTYLVAETAPRTRSTTGSNPHISFGIEKRVGGHSFQLNVSTDHGTTFGQLAREEALPRHWYLGFNLSRKFY